MKIDIALSSANAFSEYSCTRKPEGHYGKENQFSIFSGRLQGHKGKQFKRTEADFLLRTIVITSGAIITLNTHHYAYLPVFL